jgi:hypothetical protein
MFCGPPKKEQMAALGKLYMSQKEFMILQNVTRMLVIKPTLTCGYFNYK